MASQTSPPAATSAEHALPDGADDLRSLLAGYAGVLNRVDSAPAVLWVRVKCPRVLRWVRVPTPRALVRVLLVRHVSRGVEALRRRCCERVALADGAPGPLRQLARLEYFQQSLPTPLRFRVIAPLGLLGVLLVTYILANFVIRADAAALLGDLTTAAVNLDRRAAVEAFASNDSRGGSLYVGAAAMLLWSVVLMLAPLLPAFSVRRQLTGGRDGLSQVEARGFVALGCRRIRDLELDIVVQWLMVAMIPLVAALDVIGEYDYPPAERDAVTGTWIFVAVLLALAAVASAGLARRHLLRQQPAPRRRSRITSATLWLVWAINIWALIAATFVP
jgi:hypothetical protein